MHKFETFDCGLIKGQSFSEYECDLIFIFLNTYISREIPSHQNYQTLLFCSRTIFFVTCYPCCYQLLQWSNFVEIRVQTQTLKKIALYIIHIGEVHYVANARHV